MHYSLLPNCVGGQRPLLAASPVTVPRILMVIVPRHQIACKPPFPTILLDSSRRCGNLKLESCFSFLLFSQKISQLKPKLLLLPLPLSLFDAAIGYLYIFFCLHNKSAIADTSPKKYIYYNPPPWTVAYCKFLGILTSGPLWADAEDSWGLW